jgi:hypothetical protein
MRTSEKRITPTMGMPVRVLAVLGLTLLLGATVVEAQTPLLSVDPDTTVVSDGTVFTLDIAISAEVAELMGWDIAIVFNSSVIELLSVSEGALPLTSGFETFFYTYDTGVPADSVRVNGAILGHTVDGPGVLFTLEFKAKPANGTHDTDVEIVFSDLRTGVNGAIAHGVGNGYVKVITPVATETASWGFVKNLYR